MVRVGRLRVVAVGVGELTVDELNRRAAPGDAHVVTLPPVPIGHVLGQHVRLLTGLAVVAADDVKVAGDREADDHRAFVFVGQPTPASTVAVFVELRPLERRAPHALIIEALFDVDTTVRLHRGHAAAVIDLLVHADHGLVGRPAAQLRLGDLPPNLRHPGGDPFKQARHVRRDLGHGAAEIPRPIEHRFVDLVGVGAVDIRDVLGAGCRQADRRKTENKTAEVHGYSV